MNVDAAEFGQWIQRQRPGVIHVEHRRDAVGDDDSGVADRTVGRSPQRDDHDVEVTPGSTEVMFDGILGLDKLVKAQRLQLTLEIGNRIVGQEHHGVFVDMLDEQCGVEVVFVQMRDIEVVTVTEGGPVEATVVRKHEPRTEIGRVKPRVTQNAARVGIDSKTGMADAGDLHEFPLRW